MITKNMKEKKLIVDGPIIEVSIFKDARWKLWLARKKLTLPDPFFLYEKQIIKKKANKACAA